jgi:hypothetical protein
MARKYVKIKARVENREYWIGGDSTARDGEHQLQAAQRRAITNLQDAFPEVREAVTERSATVHVREVHPESYLIRPEKIPTAEEKAQTRRESLVWVLLREARQNDPLKTLTDYAEKNGGPDNGYASAANAIAWVGEKVIKADLKRAWAVSILDAFVEAGALTRAWRELGEDEFKGYVAKPAAFDEVVEHFRDTALEKALRTSGLGPAELAIHERDVAAELFRWFNEGRSWL